MIDGGSFFEPDEVEGCEICSERMDHNKYVLDTYEKLHKDKIIGMHWLWAVIDRHVAGDDINEILKDYGYERANPERE